MSKVDNNLLKKFRQDLIWVLESASLISSDFFPKDITLLQNTDSFFQELQKEFLPNLDSILSHTKEVLQFLEDRKTNRLGRYYENLWEFIFLKSKNWDLIGRGIPVRTNKSATLGEFDFLLYHKLTDKFIHLEVAIKFYLRLYAENIPSSYVGPSFNDRLDLKLKKLSKQSVLAKNPESQKYLEPFLNASDQIFHPYILVQGILFYPNNIQGLDKEFSKIPHCLSELHKRSKYIFLHELRSMHSLGSKYIIENRLNWLSDPISSDWKSAMSYSALESHLEDFFTNRNESIFVSKRNILHFVSRFFVLPDQKFQAQ